MVNFAKSENANTLTFTIDHAKQLRKLLETTKKELSLLIHDKKVYGIGVLNKNVDQYIFTITGHMEWYLSETNENDVKNHISENATNIGEVNKNTNKISGYQRLRYKHGDYYLPMGTQIRGYLIKSRIKNIDVQNIVNLILSDEHIEQYEYGALFIITDKADVEVKRLCDLDRGLRTELIDIKNKFEEASALSAIDGALFIDMKENCHGIGIILDGEAEVKGTPARGSRYNSAQTYISRCVANKIEAYAIIISSDGYLDIITSHDDKFEVIKKRNIRRSTKRVG